MAKNIVGRIVNSMEQLDGILTSYEEMKSKKMGEAMVITLDDYAVIQAVYDLLKDINDDL